MRDNARALLSLALGIFLVLSLITGCGEEERDYRQDLLDAVSGAAESRSAHLQLSGTLSPLEGESGIGLTLQGDAWVDIRAPLLEARFTVMGMELSLRYVEGKAYLLMGGKWYELGEETLGREGKAVPETLQDLLDLLPKVLSSSSVVFLGKKKVGSYDCHELEVVPDVQALSGMEAVRDLASEMGISPDEVADVLSRSGLSVRVCLQRDEPVVRRVFLAADMDLTFLGDVVDVKLLPSRGRVELTVDIPEYGVEVEVETPSGAEPFKGL